MHKSYLLNMRSVMGETALSGWNLGVGSWCFHRSSNWQQVSFYCSG